MERTPAVQTVELLQPSSSRQPQFNSLLPKRTPEEQKQWEKDHYIFISGIHTSVDYAFASGGVLPSEDNLEALYLRGYLDYPPEEIIRAAQCDDIEDFIQFARSFYEDEVRQKSEYEQAILLEIEAARSKVELPDELFKAIVRSKSFEQWAKETNGGGKSKWDRAILLDVDVPDDEKITRYKRWQLTEKLVRFPNDTDQQTARERKLNIVLGINTLSGAVLSSFSAEVAKSNSNLTSDDVELAAIDPDFDYIFPSIRKKMLTAILKAGEPIKNISPEYYYDSDSEKILLVGGLTLQHLVRHSDYRHLNKLHSAEKLVSGKDAREERKRHQSTIRGVGELILDKTIELKLGKNNAYKYKDWTNDDYIDYGRWLLSILRVADTELSASILLRAYRLGLGPGRESIERRFGSLTDYYEKIGQSTRPAGRFDHMQFEDYVELARKIASENGGKVSVNIIWQRVMSGENEPSPNLWQEHVGGLNDVLRATGIPLYNEFLGRDGCIRTGVEYAQKHGKIPAFKDIKCSPDLPSLPTIYKYCASLPNFRNLVRQKLVQEEALRQTA